MTVEFHHQERKQEDDTATGPPSLTWHSQTCHTVPAAQPKGAGLQAGNVIRTSPNKQYRQDVWALQLAAK